MDVKCVGGEAKLFRDGNKYRLEMSKHGVHLVDVIFTDDPIDGHGIYHDHAAQGVSYISHNDVFKVTVRPGNQTAEFTRAELNAMAPVAVRQLL